MVHLKTLRKGISEEELAAGKPQWEVIEVDEADVDTYLNNDKNDVWEHCSETEAEEIAAQGEAYRASLESSDEEGSDESFEEGEEEELEDHVVTQEDLDNNPELVEEGVSVGDTIQIPVSDDEESEDESAE